MGYHTTSGSRAGFSLLWILLLLATIEAGLASMGVLWSSVAHREREDELRYRLTAYKRAIVAYKQVYRKGPASVQDLIKNPKGVKFLQRLYRDPVAPEIELGRFAELTGQDGTLDSV